MQTFFTDREPRAKIVYCEKGTEEKVAELARKYPNVKVILDDFDLDIKTNCEEIETLRALKPQQVLIISDIKLVRGVDYRSVDGAGIDLLIAFALPTSRELKQLKGRVGRYGEPCSRFHVDSLTQETLVHE